MHKTVFVRSSASLILAISLLFASNVVPVHAQSAVSDQQISDQKLAVMGELVGALSEHVKLMQMLVIRQLESHVRTLQAQIDARDN